MPVSDRFPTRIIGVFACIAACLGALCVVLMGAEYDEAWVVASARQAFAQHSAFQVVPVTTTGGVHFLIVGLAQGLALPPLLLARLLSLLSMGLLMLLILRMLRPALSSPLERAIVLGCCLGAPGTILLAGMGYGIVLATTLFLAGMFAAITHARIPVRAALLGGVLIGAAIATRWTLIPALPAVLLWACASTRADLRHNVMMGILAGCVALSVFGALLWLQLGLLQGTGPAQAVSLAQNMGSAGVGADAASPARLYSFVVRFVTTLPVAVLALALVAGLNRGQDRRTRRLVAVLLATSALVFAAWVLRSPWMHLRYIWPVYLMLSLCAGLSLVALHRLAARTANRIPTLIAVAVTLGVLGAQIIVAVRALALGAAMQVNATAQENLENHFKPFQHIQEQRDIVARLRALPEDAVIASLGLAPEYGALELSLLSNRQVIDYAIARDLPAKAQPGYFLSHRFDGQNDAGRQFIAQLGEAAEQIRGYRLWQLKRDFTPPQDPQALLLDPQLYRFSLAKYASLSWY